MAELFRIVSNLNLRKNNKIVVCQPDQASTSDNQKDKESKQVELRITDMENLYRTGQYL